MKIFCREKIQVSFPFLFSWKSEKNVSDEKQIIELEKKEN